MNVIKRPPPTAGGSDFVSGFGPGKGRSINTLRALAADGPTDEERELGERLTHLEACRKAACDDNDGPKARAFSRMIKRARLELATMNVKHDLTAVKAQIRADREAREANATAERDKRQRAAAAASFMPGRPVEYEPSAAEMMDDLRAVERLAALKQQNERMRHEAAALTAELAARQ